MATFRAAHWISSDGQGEVRLTSEEQSDLSDKRLLAAARLEAEKTGLDTSTGEIRVGDWRDPELRACTAHGADWTCDRPVRARGLCVGHLAQERRGQPLRQLRSGVRVAVSLRVSGAAAARVTEDREGARAALEEWARR